MSQSEEEEQHISSLGAEVDLFYIWNQCITLVQWLLYKNIHFTKNAVKSVVLRLCVCLQFYSVKNNTAELLKGFHFHSSSSEFVYVINS